MENATVELEIKRTDLLPEKPPTPANLGEILRRETNPLLETMQRDEGGQVSRTGD